MQSTKLVYFGFLRKAGGCTKVIYASVAVAKTIHAMARHCAEEGVY